jgi:hypothetical protein
VHHLPKVPNSEVSTENDLIPPNIMWPEAGSAFEADPFSPAGTAQRQWWLVRRGIGYRGPVSFRVYLLLMTLLVVFVAGVALNAILH